MENSEVSSDLAAASGLTEAPSAAVAIERRNGPSKIAAIALIVSLVSAGAAGYAISDVASDNSPGVTSAAQNEEWDYYAAPADLEAFIQRAEESIVEILCEGTGSGFAFDLENQEPGFNTVIVTNHHVIEDCIDEPGNIEIYTFSQFEKPAEFRIIGVDKENDLALLEIVEVLPILKSSQFFAQRGWWTMAIGNQVDAGFEDSVTLYNATTFGNISYVLDDYWNYTSATVNGGNSGGPLLDNQGRVIGVNSLAGASTEFGVWNIAIDTKVLCEKLIECDE